MKDVIVRNEDVQQEFAYVYSLIRAHTNTAIAKVNAEQLQMYWEIGGYISQHLKDSSWGDHVVSELADYLQLVDNLKISGFVQLPTAQLLTMKVPSVLCLTTFTNHVEILNRCKTNEEYVFYALYAAQHHLNVEELRRCIVSQTYDSIMSKEKMINPALLKQYPGGSIC